MICGFPKRCRLLKRHQFQRLSNQGKRLFGNWIIIESHENQLGITRLGITVTKKYGKAHDRNRFKRIVREAFRLSLSKLPKGLDINIKPRTNARKAIPSYLQEDFINLLNR